MYYSLVTVWSCLQLHSCLKVIKKVISIWQGAFQKDNPFLIYQILLTFIFKNIWSICQFSALFSLCAFCSIAMLYLSVFVYFVLKKDLYIHMELYWSDINNLKLMFKIWKSRRCNFVVLLISPYWTNKEILFNQCLLSVSCWNARQIKISSSVKIHPHLINTPFTAIILK